MPKINKYSIMKCKYIFQKKNTHVHRLDSLIFVHNSTLFVKKCIKTSFNSVKCILV